jgi:tetratricopeptide (TPR) repeat protein
MVVAILPVLGLVPFEFEKRSIVADHYLYFAMIGPAMAFSFVLASLRHPRVVAVAATCCLVAWGIRSNLQTAYWRDTVTLFQHELTVNPSSEVAYGSLAERAMMNRQPDLAEAFARKSIECQPVQVEAYVNLASALSVMGRTKEALEVSRFAADKNPDNPRAVCSLATLLDEQSQGNPVQLEKAIQLCRRSVELDELWPFSRRKLSGMLLRQGDISGALREAQAAVDLDADDPRNQMAIASALDAVGRPQAAIEHLNQALQSDAKFEPAVQMLDRLTSHPPDRAR